jgi:signal peptidase I
MTVVRIGKQEREQRSSLLTRPVTPGLLLLVLLGLIIFRVWIVEMAIVDGPSMETTLKDNDRVLVLKPLAVHRFDVVVLRDPEANEPVIKRVIGMPGDVIQIVPRVRIVGLEEIEEGGDLYINGTLYHEPYATCVAPTRFGPLKMPSDSFLVLGDNRDRSTDSRSYGAVPAKDIQGVAVAIVYPFGRMGRLKGEAVPAGPVTAGAGSPALQASARSDTEGEQCYTRASWRRGFAASQSSTGAGSATAPAARPAPIRKETVVCELARLLSSFSSPSAWAPSDRYR